MRTLIVIAAVLLFSGCTLPEIEGIAIADPLEREQFEQALASEGVPFRRSVHDGEEFLIWDQRYSDRANAVRQRLFGPDLPSGRNTSYEGEAHQIFKDMLSEAGIPYSLVETRGREYVTWEEDAADRVSAVRAELLDLLVAQSQARTEADLLAAGVPPGRNVAYTAELKDRFQSWLTERDIPYTIVTVHDTEYIVWDQMYAERVAEWPYLNVSIRETVGE